MKLIFIFLFSFVVVKAQAFKNNGFDFGVGGYSENFLGETTSSPSGSPQFLGEFDIPFILQWEHALSKEWYFAPQAGYTALSRVSPGDTGKVTITYVSLLFGKNFSSQKRANWDWYFGPGVMNHHYQGAGGTVNMNNGTGTATFAQPGASSDSKMWTSTVGVSFNHNSWRFGLDIVIENLLLSAKRTQNLLLSCTYEIGGK